MAPILKLSRRELLARAAATGGVGFTAAWMAACAGARPRPGPAGNETLAPDEAHLLEAVQDRLLPSEPGVPGAREVNAVGYLRAALADVATDEGDVRRMHEGAAALEMRARERHGRGFASLTPTEQDEVLRAYQVDDEEWIGLVLVFTLEALLGDPVYGGNTNEAGWRWLEHAPGFPRPAQAYARVRS